ncbi:hypothetical protein [Motilimonas pumila]|uniref:Uncharacterized protein n=1 Tax=Motilimonas pumila TaxID=2303987 RepID=A0A418YEZ4_9GAMM|nr:hypothetical protein [Motilimonas pumila]RJG47771.1 hypothetical protein D1Z90_10255 [Motilimonas pumila]
MKFVFILLAFAVTGCASSYQAQVAEGDALLDSEISVISASCSSACKTVIENNIAIEKKAHGSSISSVMVQAFNGNRGSYDYGEHHQVFNDPMWLQYALQTLPGKQQLTVYVNYHLAKQPKKIEVTFTAKAGHRYFLGQVLDMPYRAEGSEYKWLPVVVDLTTLELVKIQGANAWLHYPG